MNDEDRIDIDGLTPRKSSHGDTPRKTPNGRDGRKFLMVWFRCCHAYGRLNRNRLGTHFVGRCPRCGSRVSARIGDEGSDRRVFEAR